MYKGRHVCRSATLSGAPEIYGRTGLDYFFTKSEMTTEIYVNDNDTDSPESTESLESSDWELLDRVRNQDIKLLKTLNVGTIIDFMVENKKVKYGMK